MSDQPLGLQTSQASVVAGQWAGPLGAACRYRRAGQWPFRSDRAVGDPDGIEVEVVLPSPGQEVDDLPTARQAVAHRVGHDVALGPDHLVTDYPAVFD